MRKEAVLQSESEVKLLSEFIKENESIRKAAKKLNKPRACIHEWSKAKKKHFVIEMDGELKVLAVK